VLLVLYSLGIANPAHVAERQLKSTEEGNYEEPVPVPPHCGRSRFNAEHAVSHGEGWEEEEPLEVGKRIVGGQVSRNGEWPWLVSMNVDMWGSGRFDFHACGGTIISDRWILTASHCFLLSGNLKPSSWRMRLGEHNLKDDNDTAVLEEVEKIITHPLRNAADLIDHDITLVKLARPIAFNEYIGTVCLPDPEDTFPAGTPCVVAGWGDVQEGAGRGAAEVNHIRLPVIERETCRKLYQNAGYFFESSQITSTTICAGHLEGGMSACQGDSGGGLICYNRQEQKWLIAGVVSYARGCARENSPGIYARVSKFLPWIEETIAKNTP